MLKIKINNTDYEVSDGKTILDVATEAGFEIPTMCFNGKLPHYSSCMVCMVKDRMKNSFLPSCSALVQEGMDIDISSEEVISLRKKALEMLLSEHRAECEAQCKVVCPGGYDIPEMNRFLIAGDLESAINLSVSQQLTAELKCIDCAGYCENACRRKKVDSPVSIRNLQLFVADQIKQIIDRSDQKIDIRKKFASRIGKLEDAELKEWLKEAKSDIRYREITDITCATAEAGSCMHCDCRSKNDCRLRDISDKLSVKDPRGKIINSPVQKKINKNTGLVFENAKCIKCGLCVRLCEELKEEPGLCFINRGFVSIISEPLTEEFDNVVLNRSKEVVEICPTGALGFINS